MSKKIIIVVVMSIITAILVANPDDPRLWDPEGLGIREGVNIEWQRTMTEVLSGEVIHVWSDTRSGKRDVYAQAVDETGVLWTQSVVVDAKDDRQEDPVIIATSDGNAIIAWIDFYLHPIEGGVYAQKIDPQGNLLWGDGIEICSAPGIQISLNIVPNNDGGAHIIWIDTRSGSTAIYGVHLDSNGDLYPGWEVNGNPLADNSGSQYAHTFWEDGENGAILAYVTTENGPRDVHAIRILENGEIDWSIVLAEHPDRDQEYVRITPLENGNFAFAWEDKSFNNQPNVAIQIIDINGNTVLPEPLPIYEATFKQENPRVTKSSDGGFFVAWEDFRTDPSFADMYIQKIDDEGNILWNPEGVTVASLDFAQQNPRLLGDLNGGCFITWDDAREGDFPLIDIYAQHFDNQGIAMWEENGKPVAIVPGEAMGSNLKISNDHLFISWADHRSGSLGIYTQVYDFDGNELFEENGIEIYWGLSGDTHHHTTVEDTDGTYIIWADSRGSNTFFRQIYAQKILHDGTRIFPSDGLPLIGFTGYHQNRPYAIIGYNGELVVTWEEQRGDNLEAYVQAFDSEGNQLWQEGGVKPYAGHFTAITSRRMRVSMDGDGGYILAWTHLNEEIHWLQSVHMQRIVNGERQWGEEGIEIATPFQTTPHFSTEKDIKQLVGNVALYGDMHENFLKVKKLNTDGSYTDGWDEDGLMVADFHSNPPIPTVSNSQMFKIGNYYYVFWNDKRLINPEWGVDDNIFAQKFNEQGEILWEENGIPIAVIENDIREYRVTYCDNYFYLVWIHQVYNVGIQKIDFDGNNAWTEDYYYISSDNYEKGTPDICYIDGRILVAWRNNSGLTEEDNELHMQLIDAETGEILGSPGGQVLANTPKEKSRPFITRSDNNNAFIAWQDGRTSGKSDIIGLYSQKVSTSIGWLDTFKEFDLPLITMELNQNYPNPFNPETIISFSIDKANPVNLSIFNIKGQKVTNLLQNEYMVPGIHRVTWNGRDKYGNTVGSGIYFYQLEVQNESQTRKMLLLK